MLCRTPEAAKKLTRTKKLSNINKKFDNKEVEIKTEASIKTPWFCPNSNCRKLTHPCDDYTLLTENLCLSCSIRKKDGLEI